ncbi:hypothetical protein GCM10023195_51130 [Actinoallomurus liliacearum]|uniref:Aldehyde dehydrogenase (NADP(+)) n=1 Tax=Actinoallomurus liliacearum TaxID=1080073 RepID=A0ABP8TRE6_9ACTN
MAWRDFDAYHSTTPEAVHGGPFSATSAPAATSVGTRAIKRFLRPVAYQNVPADLLPHELRGENTCGIFRRRDGRPETEPRGQMA